MKQLLAFLFNCAIVSLVYGMDYNQQLLEATKQGDTTLIHNLIINHPNSINTRDQKGSTALHIASSLGHIEVVKLLIQLGANVNDRDNYHMTSLHRAAYLNHFATSQFLITSGANVNAQARYSITPLHCATRQGNIQIAQLLLDNGAIVDAYDLYRLTPLFYSIAADDIPTIKLLIGSGANVNTQSYHGHTPLHHALLWDKFPIAELLIACDAKLDIQDREGRTPLHIAGIRHNARAAQLLLNNTAHTNIQDQRGNYPLNYPFDQIKSHTDQIKSCYNIHKFVKSAGTGFINETKERQIRLKEAILNNNFKSVAQLLDQDTHFTTEAQSFVTLKRQELFHALKKDCLKIAKRFLKQGFTLHTCDKSGNTLLHSAIAAGSTNCVKLLITLLYNAGLIDKYLLKKNKTGFSPLDIAITNNQQILQLLLGLK